MLVFDSCIWRGLVLGGVLSLGAAAYGQVTESAVVAATAEPASGTDVASTQAATRIAPAAKMAAPVEKSLPEIVRIRAVEGDVRVTRTDEKGRASGVWEQAVGDLPLESEFQVVTGDGRAEIEFEDASTLYLDKNSAMSFDDLHTTEGVPHSEVSLLTGTCTVDLHPAFAGEMFVVRTATDRVRVVYPNTVYERITGYVDAVAITKLVAPVGAPVAGKKPSAARALQVSAAVTVFHNNGKVVDPEGTDDPTAFVDWDAWVAGRVAVHAEAAKDVAEMSGLLDSTPGLADMEDAGVFFKCAPYGTCWVPTAEGQAQEDEQNAGQDDGQIAAPSAVGQGPEFRPKLRPSAVSIYAGDGVTTKVTAMPLLGFAEPVGFTVELPAGFTCVAVCSGQMLPGEEFVLQLASAAGVPVGSYTVPVTLSSGPLTHVMFLKIYVGLEGDVDYVPVVFDGGMDFPCGPGGYAPHLPARTPRGLGRYGGAPGYAWGVCHTGAWIYRQHRYVWVIDQRGHRPRHPGEPRPPHLPRPRPPIRWMKCKGKDVWVPRHPDDVDGKLPVNWKHVAFRPEDKGRKEEAVTLAPKDVPVPLEETPKEFVAVPPAELVRVSMPAIRAYATKDRLVGAKATAGSVLRVDPGTHGFLLVHTVKDGGKTQLVAESLETRRVGAAGGAVRGGGAASHGGGAAHAGGGGHAASGGGHAGGGSHAASSGSHGGGGSHASSSAHAAPAPSHH